MANMIKLKRSGVQGKIPTTTDLQIGEVGLNYADAKLYVRKSLGGVDSIVEIGGGGGGGGTYTVSATAPSSPTAGDRWLETDLGIEYVYVNDGNSSQWVEMGPGGVVYGGPVVSFADYGLLTEAVVQTADYGGLI